MPYYRPGHSGFGNFPTSYLANGSGRDLHVLRADCRHSGKTPFMSNTDSSIIFAFPVPRFGGCASTFKGNSSETLKKLSLKDGNLSWTSSRDRPKGTPSVFSQQTYSTSYQESFGHGITVLKRPQSAGALERQGDAATVLKSSESTGALDGGFRMATRPQSAGALGDKYNGRGKQVCKGRPQGWQSSYRQFLSTGVPHHPNGSLIGVEGGFVK